MVDVYADDDESEDEKAQQVTRLLSTKGARSKFNPEYLHKVLHELSQTCDGELFQDLRFHNPNQFLMFFGIGFGPALN